LDALRAGDWTEVTLEPNAGSDKADILWRYADGRTKAVQVKSSENQIGKGDARRWAKELAGSVRAEEYELVLIGPCAAGVTEEPTIAVNGATVGVAAPLPLNLPVLLDAAAHKLNRFRSERFKPEIGAKLAEAVIGALTTKLAEGATRGRTWTPEELAKQLEGWIGGAQVQLENRFINVPGRNDFFTGREEILSRLHATLKAEGRAAIKQAISGLGGIGKTATAIEYAHRHAEEYACVLWTNAESESALTSGFAGFAPHLGLPFLEKADDQVAAVRTWLADNPGWLLILDNADAPEVVADFLPNPLTGAVLLTSRATNFRRVGIGNPVTLEVMTEGEALAFFAKALGAEAIGAEEVEAARAVAAELGHLPLALEQAAAYITMHDVGSFWEYLRRYRELRVKIFGKVEPQAGNYQVDMETGMRHTVATTWRLNFEAVEKESAGAADILRVSAFLGSEGIPFEVIGKGAGEISEAAERATEGGAYVSEALTPLTRYSLIVRDGRRKTFDVHRLVQAVTRERLGEEERDWAERAVAAVNQAFPDVSDFYQWGASEGFLPHGTQLAGVIDEFGLETAEAARLLNQCGYFLNERARYGEALPLYERALAIREKALGAEHPWTATSLNNLAALYKAQGEYGKAEPLYERALAITEKALGAEHPSTAVSLNNLAGLYYRQRDYAKAAPLYVRALAIREKTLGKEHPDTAQSLNNVGNLYDAQGNSAKALPLLERALAIREKTLGKEHPDTAVSLNNLARLYDAQGNSAKALPLLERALAIREKKLGKAHPDTKAVAARLAAVREKLAAPSKP
jgi:tetratricopeptide (TPR) repeat protein